MKSLAALSTNVKVRIRRLPSDDGHPLFRAEVIGAPMFRRHGRTQKEAVAALKTMLTEAAVLVEVEQPQGAA